MVRITLYAHVVTVFAHRQVGTSSGQVVGKINPTGDKYLYQPNKGRRSAFFSPSPAVRLLEIVKDRVRDSRDNYPSGIVFYRPLRPFFSSQTRLRNPAAAGRAQPTYPQGHTRKQATDLLPKP